MRAPQLPSSASNALWTALLESSNGLRATITLRDLDGRATVWCNGVRRGTGRQQKFRAGEVKGFILLQGCVYVGIDGDEQGRPPLAVPGFQGSTGAEQGTDDISVPHLGRDMKGRPPLPGVRPGQNSFSPRIG